MSLRRVGQFCVFAVSVMAGVASALHQASAQPLFDASKYGIEWQSGLRYWHSTGKHTYTLSDTTGRPTVSRLTWDQIEAAAAETFFRADHWSGLFLKGHLGAGSLTGGSLKDEDFPPFVTPFSSTHSQQRDGHISYGTADLGYTVVKKPSYRLGIFGGYTMWRDRMNAFGCQQTGGNTGICGVAIPSSSLGITESLEWRAWRLGVTGDFKLSDRMTLTADAAYLSSDLFGQDWHHARADLANVTRLDASSNGYQFEALLSYALDHAFSIGVGGRYWRMEEGSGKTHFESNGGVSQASKVESERYGVFVQASYKMGAGAAAVSGNYGSTKDGASRSTMPYRWTGFYGGLHVGSGTGTGEELARFKGDAALFGPGIDGGFTPRQLAAEASGILAGLQTGYNLRMTQSLVAGVEGDVSWSRVAGAGTYLDPVNPGEFSTTIERRFDWIATLRARLGFLITPSIMVYGTGGLAAGESTLEISANDPACRFYLGCARVARASETRLGWVVGGGYEYAISSAMTWKTEYQYVDLGTTSVTVSRASGPAGNFYTAEAEAALHTVRTGVNFKF